MNLGWVLGHMQGNKYVHLDLRGFMVPMILKGLGVRSAQWRSALPSEAPRIDQGAS